MVNVKNKVNIAFNTKIGQQLFKEKARTDAKQPLDDDQVRDLYVRILSMEQVAAAAVSTSAIQQLQQQKFASEFFKFPLNPDFVDIYEFIHGQGTGKTLRNNLKQQFNQRNQTKNQGRINKNDAKALLATNLRNYADN